MKEKRERPKSFAEASAVTKMRGMEDISAIEDWVEGLTDKLQDAADSAAEQTEDKGFWGNLLTIGTTVGCMLLDPTKGAVCALVGIGAGTGARAVVDWLNPAEAEAAVIDIDANKPDVNYYRNKIPDLEKTLTADKDALENFHANEWKRDALLQLNDTWSAVQLGSGLNKLGLFAGEKVAEEVGKEMVESTLEGELETDLFNTVLNLDEQMAAYSVDSTIGGTSASGWTPDSYYSVDSTIGGTSAGGWTPNN